MERDLGDALDAQFNRNPSRQKIHTDCQINHLSTFSNEDGFNLCEEAAAQQEDHRSDEEYDPSHSRTVEPPSSNKSSMRTDNTPQSTLRPSTPPNHFELEAPSAPGRSRKFQDTFDSRRTLEPPTCRPQPPLPSSFPPRTRKRKRVEYQSRKPDHTPGLDEGALGNDEESQMFWESRIG